MAMRMCMFCGKPLGCADHDKRPVCDACAEAIENVVEKYAQRVAEEGYNVPKGYK